MNGVPPGGRAFQHEQRLRSEKQEAGTRMAHFEKLVPDLRNMEEAVAEGVVERNEVLKDLERKAEQDFIK